MAKEKRSLSAIFSSIIVFFTITNVTGPRFQFVKPVFAATPKQQDSGAIEGVTVRKIKKDNQINQRIVQEKILEAEIEPIVVQTVEENKEPPVPEPEPKPVPIQQPTSCPAQTQNCVPCYKSEKWCRYEEGEEYGYLGWACQNNNQSNIRSDPYGFRAGIITDMGGPAPCGDRGGFLIFATYADGRNAVKAYLKGISAGLHFKYAPCGHGDCTLREFFSIYAPAADQNNPDSYSEYMADRLGINSPDNQNKNLEWCVNNKLNEMVDAFEYKEGWFTDPPKYNY